ncbi:MAG: tripartite tricarboxylate transporter TctB family protein [Betaproteobacteria bacterium]|nr:tripartite tricarboxylate transporter TctB family protein [Betaproteobacteria bacterium]
MTTPNHQEGEDRDDRPATLTRGPELIVALIIVGLAGLVITDSMRVGTGWGDEGPQAGYFPFYVGLILLTASGLIVLTTLLKWGRSKAVFATREELVPVFQMLVPMVIYVVALVYLGIYLPSALLIGFFMRRHGDFAWPLTLGVSVGVPLAFFLVFEKWFLVPLPKGPIENMLGF